MNKKYQIFISSTYIDLKEERDQIIKAILEMGHFPVGMEMFSAGDDEQWKYIAKRIIDSDYYIVIVAHRYGSLVSNMSYTEKEYDFAIQQGIPTLGFIIEENTKWAADKIDKDSSVVQRLDQFKAKIRLKSHKSWISAQDLYGKVGISLGNQIQETPRLGWIRSPSIILTKQDRLDDHGVPQLSVAHKKNPNEAQTNTLNTTSVNRIKINQLILRYNSLLSRMKVDYQRSSTSCLKDYFDEYCDLLKKSTEISDDPELAKLYSDTEKMSVYYDRLASMKKIANNILRTESILETL